MPKASEYPADGTFMIPGGFITSREGNAGQAWDLGVSYSPDPWKFSVVHNESSRKVAKGQKTKGSAFTFTTDYKVRPGLILFGELDFISSKSCDYACAVYNAVRAKGERGAIRKQSAVLVSVGAKFFF
jgi:hypothetical protein